MLPGIQRLLRSMLKVDGPTARLSGTRCLSRSMLKLDVPDSKMPDTRSMPLSKINAGGLFAIDLPPTSGNDKENSTVNSQDDEYNQVDNSAAAAQDEITWNLPDGMSSEVSSPAEPTSPLSAYPALQLEPVLRDNSVTWSTNPLYDQLQYTIPIWRLG
ncbi:hypothetical protein PF008_g33149, partial [Phytophthora fragariae]